MRPQLGISKVSNIPEDSALVYFLEFPKKYVLTFSAAQLLGTSHARKKEHETNCN